MPKPRATSDSLGKVQAQLRDVAGELSDALTRGDPAPLDVVLDRPDQANLAQKDFALWDLTFSIAIEELRMLRKREFLRDADGSIETDASGRPILAGLFRAPDIFKCASMAKDAAAILIQVLKTREEATDRRDQRELIDLLVENEKKLRLLPEGPK